MGSIRLRGAMSLRETLVARGFNLPHGGRWWALVEVTCHHCGERQTHLSRLGANPQCISCKAILGAMVPASWCEP